MFQEQKLQVRTGSALIIDVEAAHAPKDLKMGEGKHKAMHLQCPEMEASSSPRGIIRLFDAEPCSANIY